MATSKKRHQYTFTVDEDMKDRLLKLPVEQHRTLADPMRAHLSRLVGQVEKRLANKGKE